LKDVSVDLNKLFEVVFLGTNGSCAYNNGKRQKYGSNTPCVVIRAGEETIILDAGSGICSFKDLPEFHREHMHLFFSHYHSDHVEGLLFCSELFNPKRVFDVYGIGDVRGILSDIISAPLYPVGLEAFQAKMIYHNIGSGQRISISDEIMIGTYSLSHPGNALGYRVEYDGKVFCYCDDIELVNHQEDDKLREFTRDVDLLVLDSSFADGEVVHGWGHSSPSECAQWAMEVNAKRMALYHYGYSMTDADIDAMEKAAQRIFPGAFAAFDGMRVVL
jgi:phosphoribosyl 1,2-cyclic phosphodiesterase